ncbi:hypothetical protein C0995_014045, partial [Termitomyces sp. Mi166
MHNHGPKSGGGSGGNIIKNGIAVKGLDGQAYISNTTHLQKIQIEAAKDATTKPTEFAGIASYTNNSTNFKYKGFMAIEDVVNDFGEELRVSFNWNTNIINNCKTILATMMIIPLSQSEYTMLISFNKKPFYIDSGTM